MVLANGEFPSVLISVLMYHVLPVTLSCIVLRAIVVFSRCFVIDLKRGHTVFYVSKMIKLFSWRAIKIVALNTKHPSSACGVEFCLGEPLT